jgi:hypothetical protein
MKWVLVVGLVCAAWGLSSCGKAETAALPSEDSFSIVVVPGVSEDPVSGAPELAAVDRQITDVPETGAPEAPVDEPMQIRLDHSIVPPVAYSPPAPPPPAAKKGNNGGNNKKNNNHKGGHKGRKS